MLRNAHVYGRKLAKAGIAPLHPAIIEGSFPGYVCTIKFGPLFPKLIPGKFGKRGGNGTKVVGRWVRLLDLKDIWISPNHFWRHRFNTLGRRHGLATDIVGALVEGAHARRSQPVAGLRRTAALCGRCRRQCRRSCRPGAIEPGTSFLSLGASGVLWRTRGGFEPRAGIAVHAFCRALPDRWHQMSVHLSAAASLSGGRPCAGRPRKGC